MKGCRPLSASEVEKICLLIAQRRHGKRDKAMFLLGIKSGFRISEILSLRVKDVFQNGKIVDRVTVERRNMKRKQEGRTVFLHSHARSALLDLIEKEKLGPDSFVFRSQKGHNRPISRMQAHRCLRRVFDLIGMNGKLGTHSMRKTFAGNVHGALGNDIFKTQQALGQKNISSTIHYLSFKQEDIEKAIESI